MRPLNRSKVARLPPQCGGDDAKATLLRVIHAGLAAQGCGFKSDRGLVTYERRADGDRHGVTHPQMRANHRWRQTPAFT